MQTIKANIFLFWKNEYKIVGDGILVSQISYDPLEEEKFQNHSVFHVLFLRRETYLFWLISRSFSFLLHYLDCISLRFLICKPGIKMYLSQASGMKI